LCEIMNPGATCKIPSMNIYTVIPAAYPALNHSLSLNPFDENRILIGK
jgi:hypothetical protein